MFTPTKRLDLILATRQTFEVSRADYTWYFVYTRLHSFSFKSQGGHRVPPRPSRSGSLLLPKYADKTDKHDDAFKCNIIFLAECYFSPWCCEKRLYLGLNVNAAHCLSTTPSLVHRVDAKMVNGTCIAAPGVLGGCEVLEDILVPTAIITMKDVWLYSIVATMMVSLCGVIPIVFIPLDGAKSLNTPG